MKDIKADFGAVGDGKADDSQAFLNFQKWAQAQTTGVILVIPPGDYSISPTTLHADGFRGAGMFYAGIADLTIFAYGATISHFYRPDPFMVDRVANITARIASTPVGAKSAPFLNAADASKFSANDWVAVTSLEMQGAEIGFPANWYNVDYVQIDSVSSTGVSFKAPLLHEHLSTFPISGPGTKNPAYDWGGPATIIKMNPTWNQIVRVFGLTVSGKTNCCARTMELVDCNFAANVPSTCTASCGESFVFRRCNIGPGELELDKNIGIAKFIDSTLDILTVQSASVETLVLDGCKANKVWGSAKNTSLINSHINNFIPGASIGFSKTLLADGCVVGSVTWQDARHFIRLSELTFNNGTFSAPVGTKAFIDVQRIAIPGTVLYISHPGGLTGTLGNHFVVTKAYQDAANIYFDTTLTALPNYTVGHYTSGQPSSITVHPCISVDARGCTGCADVEMWSKQPKGLPINSYVHRVYSGDISGVQVGAGTDKTPLWCQGELVSLKINVIRPYAGPAPVMTLRQCGLYGAFVTQMATNTLSQYLAKVDLKIAGLRIITPSSVTGSQPNDVIPVPGNIWFWQAAIDPLLSTPFTTEAPSQMPIVEIEMVTKQ